MLIVGKVQDVSKRYFTLFRRGIFANMLIIKIEIPGNRQTQSLLLYFYTVLLHLHHFLNLFFMEITY